MWTTPSSLVKLITRDVPLPVVRVVSMFVSAANRDQDKIADSADDHGTFIEKVCICTDRLMLDWENCMRMKCLSLIVFILATYRRERLFL